MASVEKYQQTAVYAMLRHNERTSQSHHNKDIKQADSHLNYKLSPDHGCSDYDYFKKHLDTYQCMKRSDIVKMASWIITAPEDLAPESEQTFFECCHTFLTERYGLNNEIQCIVHYDEIHTFQDTQTGQLKKSRPHLHYCFIPSITDKNGQPHICAKKVLTPYDLRNFHSDLQKYLNDNHIQASVYTGATQKSGGSISVSELKRNSKSLENVLERGFVF